LVHGRSGIECFDIEAVRNLQVQALVAKIDVREEPAYTALYPTSNCATSDPPRRWAYEYALREAKGELSIRIDPRRSSRSTL
jgi:2-methylcitrate dehydratase PrpD